MIQRLRPNFSVAAEASVPSSCAAASAGRGVDLWWLGQAGFLISIAGLRIVIDPYLSNSLGKKYAGTSFPHERMFPPPVGSDALIHIDWLLCTHAHTDHMDPETIGPLVRNNRDMQVLVPEAVRPTALERGVPESRLRGIDAGQTIDTGTVTISALPAAHESFQLDSFGRHPFLGFILQGGGVTVYHSGDTIPYAGLAEALTGLEVDLALLPVNGRDALRAANGIPGNLTLEEALSLADEMGARAMLGHHIDMFACNTLDRTIGEDILALHVSQYPRMLVEMRKRYEMRFADGTC